MVSFKNCINNYSSFPANQLRDRLKNARRPRKPQEPKKGSGGYPLHKLTR